MKTSIEYQEEIDSVRAELDQIIQNAESAGRDLFANESARCSQLCDETLPELQQKLKAAKSVEQDRRNRAGSALASALDSQQRDSGKLVDNRRSLTSHCFASEQAARDSGNWLRAMFGGDQRAMSYCQNRGLISGSMTTLSNTGGGFLVPQPLSDAIIELREKFGVARQNCQVVQMSSATLDVPKLNTELTAYYVGETSEITPSDVGLGLVRLDAQKLACLVKMSSELDEDASISVADMLARSIAQQFAVSEDRALFNGDGTSTYGGIVGLKNALQAGSVITCTSDQTFADLDWADFEEAVAKAKSFGMRKRWYISRAGWASSMQRLMNAAGGASISELANGAPLKFMGYDVILSEVLESRLSGTTGETFAYFGDLSMGVYLGSRRDIRLSLDGSRYFESDMLALRATERYDIVCHDTGSASAAGGVVALKFG